MAQLIRMEQSDVKHYHTVHDNKVDHDEFEVYVDSRLINPLKEEMKDEKTSFGTYDVCLHVLGITRTF